MKNIKKDEQKYFQTLHTLIFHFDGLMLNRLIFHLIKYKSIPYILICLHPAEV